MNVTSPTVVPLLPSVTRRVAVRLIVVLVGLSLLLGAAFEASAANARPADAVKSATAKKKKKRKKAPCTRWHKVRLKRHGHYVRRHGRIVRVRHCVSRKKRKVAPAPLAAPAPKASGFTVGMVSGPAPLWESNQMPGLHPRLVRFEKSIDTKAGDLAQNIGGMAAKGIEVIPMASFYGRVPSTSEAQNLASWAHAYGPGRRSTQSPSSCAMRQNCATSSQPFQSNLPSFHS